MNNLRPPSHTPECATSWRDALAVYLEARVLTLFAMGFSSGLPLLLVFGTLSFWLREADVSLTDIGYMSWVALAYGFKWLWSPWWIDCRCRCSPGCWDGDAAGCCSPRC